MDGLREALIDFSNYPFAPRPVEVLRFGDTLLGPLLPSELATLPNLRKFINEYTEKRLGHFETLDY